MPSKLSCDIAIIGGGLSGALIALALHTRKPGLDVRLIEGAQVIGGDRHWAFQEHDVAPDHRWLIAPVVAHMWRGHDVLFPNGAAGTDHGIYNVSSETLDAHVRAVLPASWLMLGRRVAAVTRSSVVLAGGDRIRANAVIDTRAPLDLSALDLAWQNRLGEELVLDADHDLRRPMLCDARFPDIRERAHFFSAQPLGPDRIFVQSRLYEAAPGMDVGWHRDRIAHYAAARGWSLAYETRQKSGVLPLCMGGDFERFWNAGGVQVPKTGVRAGLFHPLTGHALPDAVRVAAYIAGLDRLDAPLLHDELFEFARETWAARGFYRLFGTLFFRAASPDERVAMLERVYRLDPAAIARFYAGHSTGIDKVRLVGGRPVVSIRRAIAAIREKRA
ncbi:lycopene beta-cyclase CrtY [Sphingomonas sp. C3-2]|uniref:lycopene beta-cyclase CrtY n=1 Tax=Sphingomonas sp. C3-2 TaxID=3062169 RepID=UPI00294B4A53|nr:lycopene beta-cyclase CrtY [Sphingomonas sp. C3-2]WOK37862.1 lycopene beta-cyclase CrtY [Sphingomonas sp. C3-2]